MDQSSAQLQQEAVSGKPNQLTRARLMELLRYDPETGEFYWRARNGNRAGGVSGDGYWYIMIDGKSYLAHRLAWLYVHGYFPEELDHINRIRSDCRIVNLREATRSQGRMNSSVHRDNRSGFKGVSWDKRADKYRAQIAFRGKNVQLGSFGTAREAAMAYDYVAVRVFKEFARTNKSPGLLG
jgi:HNH endonuclease/AP2 domain